MSDESELIRRRLHDRVDSFTGETLAKLDDYASLLELAAQAGKISPRAAIGQLQNSPSPIQSSSHSAKDWPHAPLHRLSEHGTYMVTAGTLYKLPVFQHAQKLNLLHDTLLSLAKQYGWILEAWAVFPNHYHFVAHATAGAAKLDTFLTHLHNDTARDVNQMDGVNGRQVWFNFWDTALTFEKSYQARLCYVHWNPVKHGLVRVANQYRWCSAAWFERTARPAQVKTIYSFKTDKIKVFDDFEITAESVQ